MEFLHLQQSVAEAIHGDLAEILRVLVLVEDTQISFQKYARIRSPTQSFSCTLCPRASRASPLRSTTPYKHECQPHFLWKKSKGHKASRHRRSLNQFQSLLAAKFALAGSAPPSAYPSSRRRTGAHEQHTRCRCSLHQLPNSRAWMRAHRLLGVRVASSPRAPAGVSASQGAHSRSQEYRRDCHRGAARMR